MTISPIFACPAYSAPVAYGVPMQPPVFYNTVNVPVQSNQPATNIGPNAKGEPDLVCNARYDALNRTVELSSFERGWIDSNLWHTVRADGSGMTYSAWGYSSEYPAGTFSSVIAKAQEAYYNTGKISEDTALVLEKDFRAAATVARENGLEVTGKVRF